MNYARSNNVSGSESSDSEHNEGKKDGNACENVDNIYRDTNGNIVDHDWKLLPPIPNNHLLSLSEPHIGKGKPDIMGQNIIDGERSCEITQRDAKATSDGGEIDAAAAGFPEEMMEKNNLNEQTYKVSQVNLNATESIFANVQTCKYVDINEQVDCWGDEDISS